jgi:hypothetical protein
VQGRLPIDRGGAARCAACLYFANEARIVEAAMPGILALGSAFAAVRADDGLCSLHERYISDRACCGSFVRRHI